MSLHLQLVETVHMIQTHIPLLFYPYVLYNYDSTDPFLAVRSLFLRTVTAQVYCYQSDMRVELGAQTHALYIRYWEHAAYVYDRHEFWCMTVSYMHDSVTCAVITGTRAETPDDSCG